MTKRYCSARVSVKKNGSFSHTKPCREPAVAKWQGQWQCRYHYDLTMRFVAADRKKKKGEEKRRPR